MMRAWIAAAALFVAAAPLAHAEPKTITLDGCAKVAMEMRADGSRQSMTVKCTGEANDPKVREESKLEGFTVYPSLNSICVDSYGKGHPC